MNDDRLKRYNDSIYLTGFMATGKSTTGKELSKRLEMPFRDLDQIIVNGAGKSIHKVFEEDGEPHFRKLEREYLMELSRVFTGVVALGGGALQNQQIIDHLKLNGLLIYISTPFEIIADRVYKDTERPIVFDKQGKRKDKDTLFKELKTLYSGRKKFYEQAQITIHADRYSSNEKLMEALLLKIKQHV
ncbi:MAG: shikimate kinase [Balneolaceae bacterium]|nr:shikimate kinase [Balneolaceae bacterium]